MSVLSAALRAIHIEYESAPRSVCPLCQQEVTHHPADPGHTCPAGGAL